MCLCALAIGHGAGTPFTLPFLEFVTSDGTSPSAPDRMGTPCHQTGRSETRAAPP